MKKTLLHTLVLTLILTWSAHALIGGWGFHYAPNFTGGVKGSTNDALSFKQNESYGMQGFGTKIWLDFLPIIDVEATGNIQFNEYEVLVAGEKLETETGLPMFDKAKPMFALVMLDLTITYPFFEIPKIVKFYVGGGVSQIWSPKVLNDSFFAETATGDVDSDVEAASVAFKDKSFNTGVGGHAILGARTQLPLIPLDFYANAKYHFGGSIDKAARHGVTVEIGGGFSL